MNPDRQSPVWHPFTQHGLGDPIPLIARGEGARLYDADGNHWIDAISSWWVTTHGHAHPRIMAAIRDQSEKLDQLIFAGWTHEPAETLAATPLTQIMLAATPFWIIYMVLVRAYYAHGDTITPAVTGTIMTVVCLPIYYYWAVPHGAWAIAALSGLFFVNQLDHKAKLAVQKLEDNLKHG